MENHCIGHQIAMLDNFLLVFWLNEELFLTVLSIECIEYNVCELQPL
jgi:hypothetical protein